jgi:hypothetical protein
VALLSGRWRTAWVVAAWLFHVGVLASMAILFPYQLTGVAFAAFFRIERLPSASGARRRHVVPAPPTSRTPGEAKDGRVSASGNRLTDT